MRTTLSVAMLSCLSLCPAPQTALAAPVTWSTPFEIETDADVDLSFGPVLYAVSGGDIDGPIEELDPQGQTVPSPFTELNIGGATIPLQGLQVNTGPGSRFDSPTFGEVLDYLPSDGLDVSLSTFTERAPEVLGDFDDGLFDGLTVRDDVLGATRTISGSDRVYQPDAVEVGNSLTGNAALDSVLNSSTWADGRTFGLSTLIVDLNNLTAGKDYQVQIIANSDTREPRPGRIERNISAFTVNDDEAVPNESDEVGVFRDLDNDGFRHVNSVLGTFTADGTSQRLNLVLADGRNPGFSLLLVSEAAASGDFDADGDIDVADVLDWQRTDGGAAGLADWRSGFSGVPVTAVQTVPEPAAASLLVLGLMASANRRRDRV